MKFLQSLIQNLTAHRNKSPLSQPSSRGLSAGTSDASRSLDPANKSRDVGKGLILIFLLSSCNVGPNYHPPIVQLPSHYSATAKPTSFKEFNHLWWNSFGDPILINLINQALLGQNLDI